MIRVLASPPEREFRPLRGTDGYLLEALELGTELRIERLRRERGELVGELTVTSSLPGTKARGGTLHAADLNLSSARARVERGRILAERSNAPEVDWIGLLEDLCQRAIEAERIGEPAVRLRDLKLPEADADLVVDGMRLLRRHPVIVFGDGGDAKSYLALYWAARLAANGLRVLYADWEFAGEDHRLRLGRLAGEEDLPEDLFYVRCERPMVAEIDRLRRITRELSVDYIVCDSVAFAADGPPEAAEVAGAYFRAVRKLDVGSLHVAHITKAENGDQKPFGSTFWHNGARSTWYVKRSTESSDGSTIEVGLYNRKANTGPIAPPFGYEIAFSEEATAVRRIEIGDVSDLAARMTVRQRMTVLLRGGSRTMHEIADELDVPVDTIVKTVKRGEGKTFARIAGPDGIYRIGLAAGEVS